MASTGDTSTKELASQTSTLIRKELALAQVEQAIASTKQDVQEVREHARRA
jgi:hypothetical protein